MDNRDRRNPRNEGEEKTFEEAVISIDRVSRVVKGGRRFRFKALVVVGDKKTRVGVGVAKGSDVQAAITKASAVAKRQMHTIPLYKATIPHETDGKVAGAKVLLKPAAPGTGIIAGGTIRAILNTTGIHNILSKSLGSSNKVNTAYATIESLTKLKPRSEWITTKDEKPKKKTAPKKAEVKENSEEVEKKETK